MSGVNIIMTHPSLHQEYEFASGKGPGLLARLLGIETDSLVVSAIDLNTLPGHAIAKPDALFIHALNSGQDADRVLSAIVEWMTQQRVLDQAALYGQELDDYNIGFYRLSPDAMLSRLNHFILTDYVFQDQQEAPLNDFAMLMHRLDRDKMGANMCESLHDDFGLPLVDEEGLSWKQALRECCHPDHQPASDPSTEPVRRERILAAA